MLANRFAAKESGGEDGFTGLRGCRDFTEKVTVAEKYRCRAARDRVRNLRCDLAGEGFPIGSRKTDTTHEVSEGMLLVKAFACVSLR